MGEVHFPASVEEGRTPQEKTEGGGPRGPVGPHKGGLERGGSYEAETSLRSESVENLSVYEEVQMMRRQIAKLNHRLMAVELENQQQQQREMVSINNILIIVVVVVTMRTLWSVKCKIDNCFQTFLWLFAI